MLTRLYADNFRGLINFEIRFDQMNLLLGENGSGKSTIFEVLSKLKSFILGQLPANEVFSWTDSTRWLSNLNQKFEIEISYKKNVYLYTLEIELEPFGIGGNQVLETLRKNGKQVIQTQPPSAPNAGDPSVPKYSEVVAMKSHETWLFYQIVKSIIVLGINPSVIYSESKTEDQNLARNAQNFSSWYRFISNRHQGALIDLFVALRKIMPGFNSFSIREAGENVRSLKVVFDAPPGTSSAIFFNLEELSDGQRALIVLYSLLYFAKDAGICFFLDEPENYLSLREIEPWLNESMDRCGGEVEQMIIISHHPELIDKLAISKGRWFSREASGLVRVSDKPQNTVEGINVAEGVARGWVQ